MSADVITLPLKPRPVTIRKGDRVEHRDTGEAGTVFKIEAGRVSVMVCARVVTGDAAEWRVV